VQTEFRGDATAEGALARVERTPEETTALENLQRVLVIYMMRDRSFQEDITQMVDQVRTLQRHGHVTTITANSIKNSTIFNEKAEIAGDFNIS
jgi:hypothetical protein